MCRVIIHTGRWPLYHAAIETMVIYMEKLLGRNADAEIYIPVLSSRKASVRRATDAPKCFNTPLK